MVNAIGALTRRYRSGNRDELRHEHACRHRPIVAHRQDYRLRRNEGRASPARCGGPQVSGNRRRGTLHARQDRRHRPDSRTHCDRPAGERVRQLDPDRSLRSLEPNPKTDSNDPWACLNGRARCDPGSDPPPNAVPRGSAVQKRCLLVTGQRLTCHTAMQLFQPLLALIASASGSILAQQLSYAQAELKIMRASGKKGFIRLTRTCSRAA